MKIKLTTILALFTLISSSMGGAFIEFFTADAQGDRVKLEWKASSETNLKHYIIERSPARRNYIELATINPNGKMLYTYTDNSLFKSTNTYFNYRLKIVDYDNNVSYSEVGVSLDNLSGVKRTWGSIKAMFR